MERLRGVEYDGGRKEGWTFWISGVRWDYNQNKRTLHRAGYAHTATIRKIPLLCLDDAVVWALGFEAGLAERIAARSSEEAA